MAVISRVALALAVAALVLLPGGPLPTASAVGPENIDPKGDGSQYAYAENVGWISFACENTSSCGTADFGVEVHPLSGDFSGHAWGENIGWVTFASAGANPYKVKANWCNPPSESISLSLDKSGADALLE